MNYERLHVLAKWISWIACILMLALCASILMRVPGPRNIVQELLFGLVAIHLGAMIQKRYVLAFRLAMCEVAYFTILFFAWLYPPIPGGIEPPMDVRLGSIGFVIWILGGGLLATTAWICGRAATNYKNKHSNATANNG